MSTSLKSTRTYPYGQKFQEGTGPKFEKTDQKLNRSWNQISNNANGLKCKECVFYNGVSCQVTQLLETESHVCDVDPELLSKARLERMG